MKKARKSIKSYNERKIIKLNFDIEVMKLSKSDKFIHPAIIILFKGKKLPRYCVPMKRNPNPKVNLLLKNNFPDIYFFNIKMNPSIQDGAILIQVDHNKSILRGFSYRMHPPMLHASKRKNMGSGYDSALNFSCVKRVICVYYINKNGTKKFVRGKEFSIC